MNMRDPASSNMIRARARFGPRALATLLAITTLSPLESLAHEYWLAPSRYAAAARDTVALAVFVGTGFRGEKKPYATPRTVRFTMNAAKTIDLRPATMNGDLTFARFIAADDGGELIAYESNFVPIELPPSDFDAYLKLEGLDEPLRARAQQGAGVGPGRERYARCAKTWIAGRDPSRVLKPVGMPIEIVPLADPATASPLRVRVLYQGHPLAGALVRAWNQPLGLGMGPRDAAARDSVGPALEGRTGRDGTVALPLSRAGEWLLNAVHMVPSEDREAADWQSLWASLTFARAAKKP
jgi:uncharacterized GH25 family protein